MSLIIQTVFANLVDWLFKPLDTLCSNMLIGAFTGLVGNMSNGEWNIAITVANRIGWIMGFVNMALCIIAALQGAVRGSVADVLKSFAMAVLAWPLTAVSVSVMITADGLIGAITNRILTIPLNGNGTAGDPFGDSVVSNLIGSTVKVTAGFDLIIRIFMWLLIFFATIALAGMLAARQITLILLAGIAPLPIMMAGWKTTRPVAAKWASSVVGVLLSAPLSALVIMVGSALCYVAKTANGWTNSVFPALMGIATIIMACFSPKLIMPAVSFVGNNVTSAMQERGGKVGTNAIKAAIQVTASVVTAATAGATGGLGLGVNAAAKGVLGAAQGKPADVGGAIGQLFRKKAQAAGKPSDDDTTARPGPASGQDTGSSPSPASGTAQDGMDHTGSSQVMDSAAQSPSKESDGQPAPAPAPAPTPGGQPAPSPAAPGAPGGRGGDAHADGGDATATGGQGADGGQGGQGSRGGQGGRGGDGGRGGEGTAPASGVPRPGANGSPSGPTVG